MLFSFANNYFFLLFIPIIPHCCDAVYSAMKTPLRYGGSRQQFSAGQAPLNALGGNSGDVRRVSFLHNVPPSPMAIAIGAGHHRRPSLTAATAKNHGGAEGRMADDNGHGDGNSAENGRQELLNPLNIAHPAGNAENTKKTVQGKAQEFTIRMAVPDDAAQLYGIYFAHNKNAKSSASNDVRIGAENRLRNGLDPSKGGSTHGLVAIGQQFGDIVAYVLFQFVPSIAHGKITRVDDFCTLNDYRQMGIEQSMFQELEKISKQKGIQRIELTAAGYSRESIEKLPNVEKSQDAVWHLPKEKFGHVREEHENGNGMHLLAQLIKKDDRKAWHSLFKTAPPIAGLCAMEVVEIGTGKIVGKALYHCRPYSTLANQHISLELLDAVAPFRRATVVAIFAKLEEIFKGNDKIGAISWKANEEMMKNYGAIFESLGAINMSKGEGIGGNLVLYHWNAQKGGQGE